MSVESQESDIVILDPITELSPDTSCAAHPFHVYHGSARPSVGASLESHSALSLAYQDLKKRYNTLQGKLEETRKHGENQRQQTSSGRSEKLDDRGISVSVSIPKPLSQSELLRRSMAGRERWDYSHASNTPLLDYGDGDSLTSGFYNASTFENTFENGLHNDTLTRFRRSFRATATENDGRTDREESFLSAEDSLGAHDDVSYRDHHTGRYDTGAPTRPSDFSRRSPDTGAPDRPSDFSRRNPNLASYESLQDEVLDLRRTLDTCVQERSSLQHKLEAYEQVYAKLSKTKTSSVAESQEDIHRDNVKLQQQVKALEGALREKRRQDNVAQNGSSPRHGSPSLESISSRELESVAMALHTSRENFRRVKDQMSNQSAVIRMLLMRHPSLAANSAATANIVWNSTQSSTGSESLPVNRPITDEDISLMANQANEKARASQSVNDISSSRDTTTYPTLSNLGDRRSSFDSPRSREPLALDEEVADSPPPRPLRRAPSESSPMRTRRQLSEYERSQLLEESTPSRPQREPIESTPSRPQREPITSPDQPYLLPAPARSGGVEGLYDSSATASPSYTSRRSSDSSVNAGSTDAWRDHDADLRRQAQPAVPRRRVMSDHSTYGKFDIGMTAASTSAADFLEPLQEQDDVSPISDEMASLKMAESNISPPPEYDSLNSSERYESERSGRDVNPRTTRYEGADWRSSTAESPYEEDRLDRFSNTAAGNIDRLSNPTAGNIDRLSNTAVGNIDRLSSTAAGSRHTSQLENRYRDLPSTTPRPLSNIERNINYADSHYTSSHDNTTQNVNLHSGDFPKFPTDSISTDSSGVHVHAAALGVNKPIPPQNLYSEDPAAADTRVKRPASGHVTVPKSCPVCSREYYDISTEAFENHVAECIARAEQVEEGLEPRTLVASSPVQTRSCPMCNRLFEDYVTQEEYETHVNEHFQDQSLSSFEMLNH